jgi:hypothetical protein
MGYIPSQRRIWSLLMGKAVASVVLVVVVALVSGCVGGGHRSLSSSSAFVVDVSSDGRFAISSHRDNRIVMWDIENRHAEVISERGNIYSAAFSRNSMHYAWQDLEGRVSVVELGGDKVMSMHMPDAYSFSFAASPTRLVLTDIGWGVHVYDGKEISSPKTSRGRAALGFGKSLNVMLDREGEKFLTAGFGGPRHKNLVLKDQPDGYPDLSGLTIWDGEAGEPVHNLPSNSAKTHATVSPDGNYVVSVDENGKGFVWDAYDGSLIDRLARPGSGVWIGDDHPDPLQAPEEEVYDFEGIHIESADATPEDFSNHGMVAVQFISDTQYLLFFYNQRYAVIHELGDPFPQKFLDLGERPFPSTGSYARNASIASAPEAGILVTGQQRGNGINVYRFDEETQELEMIWAQSR